MRTLTRILLPYLGALTLAAILVCPRAEAKSPAVCRAESNFMGAIVDARDHGLDVTEVYRTLATMDGMTPYKAAVWGGQTATVYNDREVSKQDAMEAVYRGCRNGLM